MSNLLLRLISGSIFLLIFWSLFFLSPILFSIFILGILLEILFNEWPKLFNIKSFGFWFLMPVYPILPFIFILLLNDLSYRNLLLSLFIMIFVFDSACYFFGILFGKHKIMPGISPKKSWEGFIGGTIFVCLTSILILFTLQKHIHPMFVISISLIVSILGLAGDLFESWLKRRINIKDSGNLLPGHGGFLDRFDGIMFVATFFYLFRYNLIQYF